MFSLTGDRSGKARYKQTGHSQVHWPLWDAPINAEKAGPHHCETTLSKLWVVLTIKIVNAITIVKKDKKDDLET